MKVKGTCRNCGRETSPVFVHSISAQSELLTLTIRQLGLPEWDILWARRGDETLALELGGDNPFLKEKRKGGRSNGAK